MKKKKPSFTHQKIHDYIVQNGMLITQPELGNNGIANGDRLKALYVDYQAVPPKLRKSFIAAVDKYMGNYDIGIFSEAFKHHIESPEAEEIFTKIRENHEPARYMSNEEIYKKKEDRFLEPSLNALYILDDNDDFELFSGISEHLTRIDLTEKQIQKNVAQYEEKRRALLNLLDKDIMMIDKYPTILKERLNDYKDDPSLKKAGRWFENVELSREDMDEHSVEGFELAKGKRIRTPAELVNEDIASNSTLAICKAMDVGDPDPETAIVVRPPAKKKGLG